MGFKHCALGESELRTDLCLSLAWCFLSCFLDCLPRLSTSCFGGRLKESGVVRPMKKRLSRPWRPRYRSSRTWHKRISDWWLCWRRGVLCCQRKASLPDGPALATHSLHCCRTLRYGRRNWWHVGGPQGLHE